MHDGIWDINWIIEDWELHDSCLQVFERVQCRRGQTQGDQRYLAQNKEVITFLEVTGLCVVGEGCRGVFKLQNNTCIQ